MAEDTSTESREFPRIDLYSQGNAVCVDLTTKGKHVVIVGGTGTGKTVLIRHITAKLVNDGFKIKVVSTSPFHPADHLVDAMRDFITKRYPSNKKRAEVALSDLNIPDQPIKDFLMNIEENLSEMRGGGVLVIEECHNVSSVNLNLILAMAAESGVSVVLSTQEFTDLPRNLQYPDSMIGSLIIFKTHSGRLIPTEWRLPEEAQSQIMTLPTGSFQLVSIRGQTPLASYRGCLSIPL